ncbi:MAG TPA: DedA family protein [Actinomycetes bacterium]|jgi:membrane protein DedA with SNARE-associated domain|nr:DedA family protein [Actinomycetes bacterium]
MIDTLLSPSHPPVAAAASGGQELTGFAGWVVDVVGALGSFGVGVLVALENLFPPIPSELVLPLAGYLASTGRMALITAIVAATAGSVAGALVLYWAGAAIGRARLVRIIDRVPLVDVADLERAEAWFDRYGGMAVLLGRLVPAVRSLISLPAGLERMPLLRFTLYTTLGSGVYNVVLISLGYVLGERWETVGRYSDYVNYAVYAAIVLTVVVLVGRRLAARRRETRGSDLTTR